MNFRIISWPFFFFALGAISIVSQTVILREITTLFYGNELFYGLGLGLWLLFVGLGSLFAGRKKISVRVWFLWTMQGGLFIGLLLLVTGLRFLAAKMIPLGESPGFHLALLIIGTAFFIFCFPLGILFPLGVAVWKKADRINTPNKAYFWETLGFAVGGIIFAFFFAATSFPLPAGLNELTLRWRYPDIKKIDNSFHQQIIITEKADQRTFFLSGKPAFTDKENFENQQLLQLILPFMTNQKNVLLFGSPMLALEIEKELPDSKISFLETDGKLLQEEKNLFGNNTELINDDIRRFLVGTNRQWNLIINNFGNPQTLLANRYFTQDFFKLAKKRLSEEGRFILLLYLPTDYQSEEALRFGRSIYQTVKTVFSHVEILTPEDKIVIFAGETQIKPDIEKTTSVWNSYFSYEASKPERAEILDKLNRPTEELNRDLEPVGFFYQQLFLQTIESFSLPKIFHHLPVFLPTGLLGLLLLALLKTKENIRLGLIASSSSFILLAIETLVIFFFQTKIGYLYAEISLIFAAVLAGIGFGVMGAMKIKIKSPTFLFASHLAIFSFFFLISRGKMEFLADKQTFWFLLAFLTGTVGGGIYTIVNKIYLARFANIGFIYAFDLFGGFLGAVLTGGILLPVFGVEKLMVFLAGIAIINLFIISKHRR
ncbi:MAG: hypothetical protein Q8N98_01800 [bacterium]|nr:hypothetical protein [bacterium]